MPKKAKSEDALWTAIQILEEQVELTERVARRARNQGRETFARRMEMRAKKYRERAQIVKRALPQVDESIETTEVRDKMA